MVSVGSEKQPTKTENNTTQRAAARKGGAHNAETRRRNGCAANDSTPPAQAGKQRKAEKWKTIIITSRLTTKTTPRSFGKGRAAPRGTLRCGRLTRLTLRKAILSPCHTGKDTPLKACWNRAPVGTPDRQTRRTPFALNRA
jgi:hypothetical protein